jgi:GNAT superfamily N-acetyltransferase
MDPSRAQDALPPGCVDRPYEPRDDASLLDLLVRAFDGWPKRELRVPAIDHLRWKLGSHPQALASHIVVEQGGRLIAARPIWVFTVQIDGRPMLARFGVDRAVLPEFQRQGVMTALELRMPKEWHQRFEVSIALTTNWAHMYASPGLRHFRRVEVLSRSSQGSQEPASAPFELRRIETFDARIDVFWREAARSFRFLIERTMDYLNYRYADPRAGTYEIVIAEQDGSILGYVVTTASREAGHIVDLLALPDRSDVVQALLRRAIDLLSNKGVARVECWRVVDHPYRIVLERCGFETLRRTHGIELASLQGQDEEMAFFADPKSAVHIMAGDTDLV